MHRHTPARALAIGLLLTIGFAIVEVAVGAISGSLALVADAGHMLVDSAGLVLALVATLVARRPSDLRRTYGYARVEVLVVPLHVVFMLGIAVYIVVEAIRRAGGAPEIDGVPVLVAGLAGLGLNAVVLRLLAPHSHENLNARGARLEAAADALGSLGVIVSAVVVLTTGWTPVDIIISLAIAALVVPRALLLLRPALAILLESSPPGVSLDAIQRDAEAIPGIVALHDLHVWALAPSFVALSAHVEVESMEECAYGIGRLSVLLRETYGIDHVTLQPETPELHEAIACCQYPDAFEIGHSHPAVSEAR